MHDTLAFGHKSQNAISRAKKTVEIGRRIANPEHDCATMIVPALLHRLTDIARRQLSERTAIE